MTNENTLASELLAEVKEQGKRWFKISLVELIVIAIIGICVFIYFFVPFNDTVSTTTVAQMKKSIL